MIKAVLKLFLLLMVLTTISATSGKAQGTVGIYSGLINEAELAITRKDYKEALGYYNSAFDNYEMPFAQDLYNGSICALKSENPNLALAIAKRLAQKGVGENFFIKSSTFDAIKGRKGWNELLEIARQSRQSIETNESCKYIDDLLRKSDLTDSLFFADFDPGKETARAMAADTLSWALLKFIDKNGYPSEETIGVTVIHDTLLSALPKYAILLSRRSPVVSPGRDSVFKEILLAKGIKNGKLKPDAYLNMTTHSLNPDDIALRMPYSWLDCFIYIRKGMSKERIDSFRHQVGASSLADYTRKLIYTISFPHTIFSLITLETNEGPYLKKHPEEMRNFLERHLLEVRINSNCPY